MIWISISSVLTACGLEHLGSSWEHSWSVERCEVLSRGSCFNVPHYPANDGRGVYPWR